MSKQQDCIIIANNEVIFQLEEEKKKRQFESLYFCFKATVTLVIWIGKISSMEGQHLHAE